MDLVQLSQLLKDGGLPVFCGILIIGIIALWFHHIKIQKASAERHQKRDEDFQELQKYTLKTVEKANVLLEIIVNKGQA